MKILTWNINGYRSTASKNLFNPILKLDCDIICLQEIKMNEKIKTIKKYNCYYNFATKLGYSGLAVLTKEKPISIINTIDDSRFDSEGRFLLLEFSKYILINLYVPQGGRYKENLEYKLNSLNKIFNLLSKYQNKNIIICTDFNIAHKDLDVLRFKDNYNNIMFTKEERRQVDKLLSIGFVDSFRYKYPDKQSFSWWANAFNCRARNIGWRIDYIFVTNSLKTKVIDINYLKDMQGSDHCPLLLELQDI